MLRRRAAQPLDGPSEPELLKALGSLREQLCRFKAWPSNNGCLTGGISFESFAEHCSDEGDVAVALRTADIVFQPREGVEANWSPMLTTLLKEMPTWENESKVGRGTAEEATGSDQIASKFGSEAQAKFLGIGAKANAELSGSTTRANRAGRTTDQHFVARAHRPLVTPHFETSGLKLRFDAGPDPDLSSVNRHFTFVDFLTVDSPGTPVDVAVELRMPYRAGGSDIHHAFVFKEATGRWRRLNEPARAAIGELLLSKFLIPLHARLQLWPETSLEPSETVPELVSALQKLMACERQEFPALAAAVLPYLRPATDFRAVRLGGVDIRGQDLTAFDLTEADLSGSQIDSKTLFNETVPEARRAEARDQSAFSSKLATDESSDFAHFVPDVSNREALAVARAVASWNEEAPRFLVISGPPDSGKTHLLKAIGREAAQRRPVLNVSYVDDTWKLAGRRTRGRRSPPHSEESSSAPVADADTSVWAIKLPSPDNAYEDLMDDVLRRQFGGDDLADCDLLLIDDLDSPTARHVPRLEAAIQRQARVVVATNLLMPSQIEAHRRLQVLGKPTYVAMQTASTGLVDRVLEQWLARRGTFVPTAVLSAIRVRFPGSLREALAGLQQASERSGGRMVLDAEDVPRLFETGVRRLSPNTVRLAVAEEFGIRPEELLSPRSSLARDARDVLLALTSEFIPSINPPRLARLFGAGTDGLSVTTAIQRLPSLEQSNQVLADAVIRLRRTFQQGGTAN